MKRKFYDELLDWAKNNSDYPLIVSGARQVGKTYIIDEFCRNTYKNYIYFNLMKDAEIVQLFESINSFEYKVNALEIKIGMPLDGDDTIIFFDEAQNSEKLIESLKFFKESDKNYKIICAGSLLGVAVNRMTASYPVGKVKEKELYPMDFEEFLMATGNERYIEIIKESFLNDEPLPDNIHNFLIDSIKKYFYLGGMPEVIKNYIMHEQNIVQIEEDILENIIDEYLKDMKQYNKNSTEHIRIKAIYNSIPAQLIKENQKFIYTQLDNGKTRKRDYISPLDWLISSGLVLKSNLVTNTDIPLKVYIDDESYKLYLNDTGILARISNTPANIIILPGDHAFNGVIAENYVATELIKMGFDLFYWSRKGKNKGNAEVDFVIQTDTRVVPVEVKLGNNIKSKSLDIYKEVNNPEYMIRISAKNFGFHNNIKSIPIYATFCLKYLK